MTLGIWVEGKMSREHARRWPAIVGLVVDKDPHNNQPLRACRTAAALGQELPKHTQKTALNLKFGFYVRVAPAMSQRDCKDRLLVASCVKSRPCSLCTV